MTPWLPAGGACLVAGLAATWFLYSKRLPHERHAAGRALLAAMDHADFMQLVLAVLNGRGYERTFGGGGTEGEYLVERHGRGWLLSSKYSHAYTPDSTAIAEFASYLRHRGVPGGVLAISGRFPRAAFGVAQVHRVELLDSQNMWEELQPLLDPAQQAAIDRPARARLKRQFVLAWVGAVVLGLVVYLATRTPATDTGSAPPVASTAAAAAFASAATTTAAVTQAPPAATDAAGTAATAADAAATNAAGSAPADTSAGKAPALDVEHRRRAIADAVARLPHVRSATWPIASTLQVVVDSDLFEPRTRLCALIEDDPDLRTTRLQVEYPASSTRPIRFLQCRSY